LPGDHGQGPRNRPKSTFFVPGGMKIFGVFLHKNDIYGHLTMFPSKQQSTSLFRIVLGRENGWYNEEWGEVTCKRSNPGKLRV